MVSSGVTYCLAFLAPQVSHYCKCRLTRRLGTQCPWRFDAFHVTAFVFNSVLCVTQPEGLFRCEKLWHWPQHSRICKKTTPSRLWMQWGCQDQHKEDQDLDSTATLFPLCRCPLGNMLREWASERSPAHGHWAPSLTHPVWCDRQPTTGYRILGTGKWKSVTGTAELNGRWVGVCQAAEKKLSDRNLRAFVRRLFNDLALESETKLLFFRHELVTWFCSTLMEVGFVFNKYGFLTIYFVGLVKWYF